MDTAVHEDTTGVLRVGDEEAGGIELVAGLRADHGGSADEAGKGFGVGVTVGGVEAAGEAAHDFKVGRGTCGGDY